MRRNVTHRNVRPAGGWRCICERFVSATKILFFLFVISFFLYELYIESYVWQVTTLRKIFHPVSRIRCDVPEARGASVRKASIGILYVYRDYGTNEYGSNLMLRVLRNRKQYCEMHNYTLIDANHVVDLSRPIAWSKLRAVKQYLEQFDYVVYMDMDIVIMDLEKPIEEFISIAETIRQSNNSTEQLKDYDIIMTEDWNGPNTGVWIARDSKWSKWFLELLWDQKQFMEEQSPNGIPYPFEYEQRAFHYILSTKIWKKRRLPKYPGDSESILKHIVFLPQCAFNSYSTHPLDLRGSLDDAQYAEGDFLIHFAGKKGRIKSNLINAYLDVVERRFKYK